MGTGHAIEARTMQLVREPGDGPRRLPLCRMCGPSVRTPPGAGPRRGRAGAAGRTGVAVGAVSVRLRGGIRRGDCRTRGGTIPAGTRYGRAGEGQGPDAELAT